MASNQGNSVPDFSYSIDYAGKGLNKKPAPPPSNPKKGQVKEVKKTEPESPIAQKAKEIFGFLQRSFNKAKETLQQAYRRHQWKQMQMQPQQPTTSQSMEVDLTLSLFTTEKPKESDAFVVVEPEKGAFLGNNWHRLEKNLLNHFKRVQTLEYRVSDIATLQKKIEHVRKRVLEHQKQETNLHRQVEISDALLSLDELQKQITDFVKKHPSVIE